MAESQSDALLKSRRQVLKIVAAGGADLPGCEGYFVTKDLDIVKTSGFTVSG